MFRNALAFGKLKKRIIVKYFINKTQNIDKNFLIGNVNEYNIINNEI